MKKNNYFTKSLLVVVMLCVCASTQAFGQISNGSPTARTIKTGNRPGEGDWGLYVGVNTNQINALGNREITWKGIPILNFKYFVSDNFEARLGFLGNSTSQKMKGDIYDVPFDESTAMVYKAKEGEYCLYPGFAYHFSETNILDVYVGCSIPLGLNYDKYTDMYDGKNWNSYKRSSFEIGFEGFVGLQCFIADLPLAIGMEYGFSAVKYFGQKYKHIVLDADDHEQTYYSTEAEDTGEYYKNLKRSSGKFESEVRFTISYYFNM